MKEKTSLPLIDYWTREELDDLKKKLNQRRGSYLKARYLLTLAYEMIHDNSIEQQKKGVSLMKMMIELFPNEYMITMGGNSCLGKYYRSVSDYEKAVFHFKKIMDYNHSTISTGKYDMPEFQIALTIILLNQGEKYGYARELLDSINPRTLFIQEHRELYYRMKDFLDGKIHRNEVKSFFHEY